jgi:predicted Holliday junction resolvase-like endonuclease
MLSGKLGKRTPILMAIDREFLGKIDREIASLRGRIETKKREAASGHQTADHDRLLRETEDRLKHLEELRKKVIEQSAGG